jgi:hypothetical protein
LISTRTSIFHCTPPINTKNKTIRWLGGYDANGSGELSFSSNLWASTDAINSIKIKTSTDNFAEFSQFSLYGVKG